MWTICRKELADHFSSIRFLILFWLILMVALVSAYMAAAHVREALEGLSKPSQVFLLLVHDAGQVLFACAVYRVFWAAAGHYHGLRRHQP